MESVILMSLGMFSEVPMVEMSFYPAKILDVNVETTSDHFFSWNTIDKALEKFNSTNSKDSPHFKRLLEDINNIVVPLIQGIKNSKFLLLLLLLFMSI